MVTLCIFDAQKAKSQLKSTLEQLHMKAISDLMSPESVAEQSSLTLETARSHKVVWNAFNCDTDNASYHCHF